MESDMSDIEMQDVYRDHSISAKNPMQSQSESSAAVEDISCRDSSSVESIVRNISKADSVLSNGVISYDKFSRLSSRMKQKIEKEIPNWDDDDEKKSFLQSSHLVLYKWRDYCSVPLRHPFANILYGERQKDSNGVFLKEDNQHRFLFIFHDRQSFFTMGLAYLVLFGEISILVTIVSELFNRNCKSGLPKGNVKLVPLILCTLYASSVAAESFFRFTPFELTGQTREGYCAIAQILVALGHKRIPRYINFYQMFKDDLSQIALNDSSRRDEVNRILIESQLQDTTTFILTIALQFANILLLTTVAIVMGTSRDLLSLIQDFVSVEIVVHIHEFVPLALRLRDLSPHSFNSSFNATAKKLESVGLLQVYTNDDPPKRLRWDAEDVYKNVFIAYCIYTLFIYWVTNSFCSSH